MERQRDGEKGGTCRKALVLSPSVSLSLRLSVSLSLHLSIPLHLLSATFEDAGARFAICKKRPEIEPNLTMRWAKPRQPIE